MFDFKTLQTLNPPNFAQSFNIFYEQTHLDSFTYNLNDWL